MKHLPLTGVPPSISASRDAAERNRLRIAPRISSPPPQRLAAALNRRRSGQRIVDLERQCAIVGVPHARVFEIEFSLDPAPRLIR
jgi:hypothetical protein